MKDREVQVKTPGRILGILLVILLFVGSAMTTVDVSKRIFSKEVNIAQSIRLDELSMVNYAMYLKAMNAKSTELLEPSAVFLNQEIKENEKLDVERFNNDILGYESYLDYNEEIEYLVYDDSSTSAVISHEDGKLSNLYMAYQTGNQVTIDEAKEEITEDYLYYAIIQYDSNGDAKVIDSYGRELKEVENAIKYNYLGNRNQIPIYEEISDPLINNRTEDDVKIDEDGNIYINGEEYIFDGYYSSGDLYYSRYYSWESDEYYDQLLYKIREYVEPSQPKNVTMVVAINREVTQDFYGDYRFYMNHNNYIPDGFVYLLIGMLAIILVAALIAACIRSLGIATGIAYRIPLEVVVAAAVGIILITPAMAWFTQYYADGVLYQYLIDISLPDYFAQAMNEMMVHGAWFLYYGVIFFGVVSVLSIFRKGFKRYCVENILVIRFLVWIKNLCVRCIKSIVQFNYDDTVNKFVVKIVALNFLIIAVMCSIWFFGIPVLIIYSFVLFYFLQKYMTGLKEKYDQILYAAHNMAEGNLEFTVNENLGVFSPIAKELNKVQNGFKCAVDEEVKSQRLRTELITNVSHDLKTPLTAIITYINLLKEEDITDEQRTEYIETLDNKALRLKQLIEDLFEVSKINSNNITLDPVEVDVIELIKQAQVELSDRFEEAGIEFRMTAQEEKVILMLDSQKTYRIFENLFVNVVKYAQPGTRAYMTVVQKNGKTEIVLKNVSAHELNVSPEQLTERFVRGDESRHTEGSGLGLAIVKSIVEIQGGKFDIEIDGDLFKAIILF